MKNNMISPIMALLLVVAGSSAAQNHQFRQGNISARPITPPDGIRLIRFGTEWNDLSDSQRREMFQYFNQYVLPLWPRVAQNKSLTFFTWVELFKTKYAINKCAVKTADPSSGKRPTIPTLEFDPGPYYENIMTEEQLSRLNGPGGSNSLSTGNQPTRLSVSPNPSPNVGGSGRNQINTNDPGELIGTTSVSQRVGTRPNIGVTPHRNVKVPSGLNPQVKCNSGNNFRNYRSLNNVRRPYGRSSSNAGKPTPVARPQVGSSSHAGS